MTAPIEPFDVLHVVRLRGVIGGDAIAAITGAPQDEVGTILAGLVDDGSVFERQGRRVSGFTLTEAGRARHARELPGRADPAATTALATVYDSFLEHNGRVKALCGRWQQVGTDDAARWKAIGDLEDLHGTAEVAFTHAGDIVPRFARYATRLRSAMLRVAAGDERYFTSPLVDSYHTVWFEAHEDFIVTLGRDRVSEGSF